MKAKNFAQNSLLYHYVYGVLQEHASPYVAFVDYVGCPAVTHGNHVLPNAWSYTVYRINYHTGTAKSQWGNYGGPTSSEVDFESWNGPLQGLGFYDPSSQNMNAMLDNAYNEALSKLNEKVRGGLDLSVDMGQASETARMVKNLAKWNRWFNGFGPKRWAREWLEYTYGWKPLLKDIYDAAGEIQHKNASLLKLSVRASQQKTVSGGRNVGRPDISDTGGSGYVIQEGPVVMTKLHGNVKAMVTLGVTLSPPTDISNASRWTSLNPLSIAWELMPYSFVVDWFYDIGGFLRNAETALINGPRFVTGFRSNLRVQNVSETVDYNASGIHHYFTGVIMINTKANFQSAAFERSVLVSYPLPHVPHVKTDLSAGRLLNAAALLAQKLR